MNPAGNRNSESADETDGTRTVGDTVRGSKQQSKAGFGVAIRKLFRQVAKALADAALAPKKSDRRGGKGVFSAAADRTTRPRHLPARRSALSWLADTLDWFMLWHNADPGADLEPEEDHAADPSNHLFPHL
jgi:hypothetical protein